MDPRCHSSSSPSLSYGSEAPPSRIEIRTWRQKRSVIQKQVEENRSSTGFKSFRLVESLQRGIDDAGFTEPRPIQWDTIPAALDGDDVLGLAQTGTGKTCAFAVPIIERILTFPLDGPRVLIVAPTRELVLQIQAELQLLARHTKIRSVAIFGGTSAVPQIRTLRSNPEVIVACPGRLLDLYNQGKVNLKNIETLVLDEADHMFDQGFLPDIKRILSKLPKNRQNLLFSATMPPQIRHLADNILYKPHVVDLGDSAPAETIEHALCPVSEGQKFDLLEVLLNEEGYTTAIVFLRTKARAKRTAQKLAKRGFKAVALQGNMSQPQRVKAMEGFRNGAFDILVATDIAARGIDVADVSQVINYDVPNTPDTYTHRIGRTGRSEKSGRAYTLFARDDAAQVKAIEKKLGSRLPRMRFDGFDDKDTGGSGQEAGVSRARRSSHGRGRGRGRPTQSEERDQPARAPRSSRGKKRQRKAQKSGGQFSGGGAERGRGGSRPAGKPKSSQGRRPR
ncbi:MAG: DEAD/DEAH box helicase [Planctomycetota bacterium]|nr:DEAD/DEAH box helicase [Planctomycetota bacterium]